MVIFLITVYPYFTGSEDYTYLFRYLTNKYLKYFENEIAKEFPNIDYFGKTILTKNYKVI